MLRFSVSQQPAYTPNKNYKVERTFISSNGQTVEDVVYTDGFGRKLQEIQVHGAPDGTLSLRGYYPAGALQKTTVTDEDGHTAVTYTDNRDREVLTLQTADDGMKLETYRVYDDRGMLRWVLSPEASFQIQESMDTDVLEKLAYYYEYDALGRMTLKRLPGCMPTRMVYDRRNRMVMSQDGNQRQENARKWCYSVYDDTNRVTETGEIVLGTDITHEDLRTYRRGDAPCLYPHSGICHGVQPHSFGTGYRCKDPSARYGPMADAHHLLRQLRKARTGHQGQRARKDHAGGHAV